MGFFNKAAPRTAESVGVSVNSLSGLPGARSRSKVLEAAMVAAVEKAMAYGVSDPDKLRAVMADARVKAKAAL